MQEVIRYGLLLISLFNAIWEAIPLRFVKQPQYALRAALPGDARFFSIHFPSACAMYWIKSNTLQE